MKYCEFRKLGLKFIKSLNLFRDLNVIFYEDLYKSPSGDLYIISITVLGNGDTDYKVEGPITPQWEKFLEVLL